MAGQVDAKETPRLGSYESWIKALAPILQSAGWDGFLATAHEDSETAQDTRHASLKDFVETWARQHGDSVVSTHDLCLIATDHDLQGVRKSPKDGRVSTGSLGMFLARHRGVVVSGLVISDKVKTEYWNGYRLQATNQEGNEILEAGRNNIP